MGRQQILRGNPELKQVYMMEGFNGGVNVTFADDILPTNSFRDLQNYDIESYGELSARKGFGLNPALTILLSGQFVENENTVFFTLLDNDENAFSLISASESLNSYLQKQVTPKVLRTLKFDITSGDLRWKVYKYTLVNTGLVTESWTGTISSANFAHDGLFPIQSINQFGKIYFTANDTGMLVFDAQATDPSDPITFIGDFGISITNSAYKPNGVEVRKVGFNALGTDPLSWIDSSNLVTESIQGVFLTLTDRSPIKIIPAGTDFQINIIYTGSYSDFTITFNEWSTAIEATLTKNTTLTTTGLAVYDVTLSTQPTNEAEIVIEFSEPTIELEPYYDYYYIGPVPADAKPVETLNLGEYKMLEVYDRAVYYKGNEIWFSEIMRYDYIPNYNFVLLPLEPYDEITKIHFFRSSYIVFTKRRIYKLSGSFEYSDFSLTPVNQALGCIAPNTTAVVENELFFLSDRGLRSLKSDYFREGLENVKEFDQGIWPLVKISPQSYGFVYKDQYFLMQGGLDAPDNGNIRFRDFPMPDQVRYYYRFGSFMTDFYPLGVLPEFIFHEQGYIHSFKDGEIFTYGRNLGDFGEQNQYIIETPSINFGYPVHQKKIKAVLLKCSGGELSQKVQLDVFADGAMVYTSTMVPVDETAEGTIIYEDLNATLDDSLLPITIYGEGINRMHTKKLRVNTSGKNIAVRLTFMEGQTNAVQAIGFIWKLGKVKE